MKNLSSLFHWYSFLSFLIILTLAFLIITSIRSYDVQIAEIGGKAEPTSLPIIRQSTFDTGEATYNITGKINYSSISQHIVNITADDCIDYFLINDVPVNLQNSIHGQNCDVVKGLTIDLSKYLRPGTNKFQIGIEDYGGWLGLAIKSSYSDTLFFFLLTVLLSEVILLQYFLLKNYFHLNRSIIFILIVGLLIRVVYLSYTTYSERTYDVMTSYTGHLTYIQYVGNNLKLPNPDNAWEYHQAPLYYIISAFIYRIANSLMLFYPSILQVSSLVYSTVFLLFGTLILKILLKKKSLFILGVALLSFWPSAIIHSIRIGNDPIYYMMYTIAVYFMVLYSKNKLDKYFYFTVIFISLTILTKLNGLILLFLFIPLFIYKQIRVNSKSPYLKKLLLLLTVISSALYFSLFRNYTIALQDPHFNLINGSSAYIMDLGFKVGNNFTNYLQFDLRNFLSQPFTSSWVDSYGRQYFWNYFLKTMLFGEYTFNSFINRFLAIVLSFSILEMVFFLSFGIFYCIRKADSLTVLMFVWIISSLLSLLAYRHTYPFSSNGDFRFISPILIPFFYFYLKGIDSFVTHKLSIIGYMGYAFSYLFIFSSCIFFLYPLFAT